MAKDHFARRLLAHLVLYQGEHEETGLQSQDSSDFSKSRASCTARRAGSAFLVSTAGEMYFHGEVAEWSKAPACKGWYALKGASEVRILPLSEFFT